MMFLAIIKFERFKTAHQAKEDMLANIARFGMGFANVFSLPLMFSGLRSWALDLKTQDGGMSGMGFPWFPY